MSGENEPQLGAMLRQLRVDRRLSLSDVALRTGLSKAAIGNWELGNRTPRGASLVRLLDGLRPEPRVRAQLLHAADPAFARIALARTPLGAPVDVGRVIRAMRGRRGYTQRDLSRAIGVSQASVARWESGDDAPTAEMTHMVGHALGARIEETLALARVRGAESSSLPNKPTTIIDWKEPFHRALRDAPIELQEIISLGMEAEIWHQAVQDPRWDYMLCDLQGRRAVQYFLSGRLDEADATARRALRMARSPEVRIAATQAFSALLEIATHQNTDPNLLAKRIEAWAEGLPQGHIKGWMLWEKALRLADSGQVEEALEVTCLTEDMIALNPLTTNSQIAADRAASRMEVELRAGRPKQAEEYLPIFARHADHYAARFQVRIAHGCGEPVDEATFAKMRADDIEMGNDRRWYTRQKIQRIERAQRRLVRRR